MSIYHTVRTKRQSPTENRTQGDALATVFIPKFVFCSSSFPKNLIQLQKAKRLMQMHTFIHANCITVETHPATRPVDTLVPQSQHTLTDQNPIQGNKAEMPKAKTKKKKSVQDISERRGGHNERSFVLICVPCYPHMQMHTHYYGYSPHCMPLYSLERSVQLFLNTPILFLQTGIHQLKHCLGLG